MPARRLGFQAVYRTADPEILAEFHEFFVSCVAAGRFERLMLGVKMGLIDFSSSDFNEGHILLLLQPYL